MNDKPVTNDDRVETQFHIEPMADGKRARVNLSIRIDGIDVGFINVLSGPIHEAVEFYEMRMTLPEVQEAWKGIKDNG